MLMGGGEGGGAWKVAYFNLQPDKNCDVCYVELYLSTKKSENCMSLRRGGGG